MNEEKKIIRNCNRREFIRQASCMGVLLPTLTPFISSCNPKKESQKPSKESLPKGLKILILGGTSFLGPHQIAYALSRGHKISIFTRGKSQPTVHIDVFDKVEQLIGDRENDLKALENREWDAVIDNSGRKVEWTQRTAELLKQNVQTYVYTSSTGVYYPYLTANANEKDSVVLTVPKGIVDDNQKGNYDYGVMKANSELATISEFGSERSIIVRPTYMMGPGDKTDRFMYWPIALARGEDVIVPGHVNDPVQYIDVRDVAEWMIRLIEMKNAGTYNAVGPQNAESTITFVKRAQSAFKNATTIEAIDDYSFLKENNLEYIVPWIMPDNDYYASARIDNGKAKNNGLSFRDTGQTIKETHDWWYSSAVNDERRNKFEQDPNSILMRAPSIIEKWKSKKE